MTGLVHYAASALSARHRAPDRMLSFQRMGAIDTATSANMRHCKFFGID